MAKKKTAKKRTNGAAVKKKPAPKKKSPKQKSIEISKKVRINRSFPDGQQVIFSNHFVVQHHGPDLYLMFFHTSPPLLLGSPEEIKDQVSNLESVESECVARVVVSRERMPAIIAALQETYDKYKDKPSSINEIDLNQVSPPESVING
ncbi:MAG: DUF3467 domain-containing protein [Planctomycetaceae bacterium]|nr:DUF3467 domain-containing protein [Planctomycetaceae bacterium]